MNIKSIHTILYISKISSFLFALNSFTFFTTVWEGTSFVTIAPAAIVTSSPIFIGPIIVDLHPNMQSSPIFACLLCPVFLRSSSPFRDAIIVQCGYILHLFPIIAVLPITIPWECETYNPSPYSTYGGNAQLKSLHI